MGMSLNRDQSRGMMARGTLSSRVLGSASHRSELSVPREDRVVLDFRMVVNVHRSGRVESALGTSAFPGKTIARFGAALAIFLCAWTAAATTLTVSVNGGAPVNADYSTTHVFVDEVAGDAVTVTAFFDPQTNGVATAEVLTNLNRRDRAQLDANGDGIEDGIKPPDARNFAPGEDANYFKAFAMTQVAGGFQLTLNAANAGPAKTGAYRLTARYRLNGEAAGTWHYFNNDGGHRDHAIVVSPKKTRDMVMYEINPLTVEAEGTLESQRSTFVDLWDGPGSTRFPRWNLDYLRGLGCNWLWFQPIHPMGIDGRHLSAADINARAPGTGATTWRWNGGAPFEDVNYPYTFGSPYAVKNFFEIEPRMSKANTRAAALQEFRDFVNAADAGGANSVNVMLDAPFNHTAWDAELAAMGVQYFSSGASPTDEIRNREARFFSRSGNYAMRASGAGNIAVAPDRGDFGKFFDTLDVYYGRYASLVAQNPQDNGNRNHEGDWFDYSIGDENSFGDGNGHFDGITQKTWRYFADYCLFWLTQTGCTAGTSPADQVWKGIDGLRADFGQGIPPQAWEYMINVARSRKWAFVFMAESLDGGAVTYRSARHFDVLNENILFAMKGLSPAGNTMTSDFRGLFESRRAAYGQGLVLLNTVSHDEDHYLDPWQALVRFAACSAIDGVPMIFPGQELGISTFYGYDLMEKNFGKYIPHFKTYNSLQPLWNDPSFGNHQLYPVYAGINAARQTSPALRSPNRYFLDQLGGGTHQRIFSTAKYEAPNASPATSDVVFAFTNLDRDASPSGTFNVAITQNGSNLFGIKAGRNYNVVNLSAYGASRRQIKLWGTGRTGAEVLASGVFVALNKVPTADSEWGTAPYEAQFLKLLDTTSPSAAVAQPSGPNAFGYAIGRVAAFSWAAVAPDSEGVVPWYRVTIRRNGVIVDTFVTSATTVSVDDAEGTSASLSVQAVNPNDTSQTGPASAASVAVKRLNAAADEDGDGLLNSAEDAAGTNPFDPESRFRIISVVRQNESSVQVVWASVAGRKYLLEAAGDLATGFAPVSGVVQSTGSTTQFTDTAGTDDHRFYRVTVVP